jgi:hypothetical protein
MSEELQRQININLHLRRQLERARREVMLYAAQVCEDHDVGFYGKAGWVLVPLGQGEKFRHAGAAYAKKLREIAGE